MDEILEHLPKLLEPLFEHINRYYATVLAIGGTVVAILMQKKKELKQRRAEKRMESKIDAIMGRLNVEWNAEKSHSPSTSVHPSSRLFINRFPVRLVVLFITQRMINLSILLRSVGEVTNVNWFMLAQGLLGATKLILEAFGIKVIDDDQINTLANGIATLMTVLGVLMSNRKKGAVIGERVNYAKADDLDA